MLVSIESVLMQGGAMGCYIDTHTASHARTMPTMQSGRTLARTMPTLTELRQRLGRLGRHQRWASFQSRGLVQRCCVIVYDLHRYKIVQISKKDSKKDYGDLGL